MSTRITCPECHSSKVTWPARIVGKLGQVAWRYRCLRCMHIWEEVPTVVDRW